MTESRGPGRESGAVKNSTSLSRTFDLFLSPRECTRRVSGATGGRQFRGLPELSYPFHDRTIRLTGCGCIILHRKKINLSTVFAGKAVGIRGVDEGLWLVSFIQYDLG